MFNFAKKKKHLPPDLFPAKLLHDQKQADRKRSIKMDAELIGRLVAQTGQSAEDMMFSDKYWEYVWKYDKKYAEAVVQAAEKKVAPRARLEAENPTPNAKLVAPMAPPPQPGGGQGGAPGGAPPMASSRGKLRKEAAQHMFLHRKGPHRLRGTLVSRLLSGKIEIIGEDGQRHRLRLPNGDAAVSRIGSAAKEAIRLVEEMPRAVMRAIESTLDGHVDRPDELARTIATRYWASGRLDLVPLAVATDGPARALMMMEGLPVEPDMAPALMIEVGRAMGPFVRRLRGALRVEGIPVEDVVAGEGSADEEHPRVLDAAEAAESMHVPSLIMTAACPVAGDEQRRLAAERLVFVMCRFPEAYEPHKLSVEEAERMGSPSLSRMIDFVRLYEADDAGVMEAYFDMAGDDRLLLSHMVSSQRRRAIMDAVPEMCLQETNDGIVLNDSFFDGLDLSNEHSRNFLRGLIERLSGGGKVKALEKVLLRKLMQALASSPDEYMEFALTESGPLSSLRILALCILAEDGEYGKFMDVLDGGPEEDLNGPVAALLSVAIFESNMGDLPHKVAWKKGIRPRPAEVAALGGRAAAFRFMRDNRIDWDGDPIPHAHEIMSAPDDPLPLAKCLLVVEDDEAMLILLRECVRQAKRGNGKDLFYPISFMSDALSARGRQEDASATLDGLNAEMDDERMVIRRRKRPRRSASLPGGGILTGKDGMFEARAGAKTFRFASRSANAFGIGVMLTQGKAPPAP